MVVFGVSADPEPRYAVGHVDTERAIPLADAAGPDAFDLLEMKRWMARVRLQQRELFVGQ